ncbi:MAG TPA: hypothetical protein PK055_12515 [Gammaproteobacteria bacterium]|jgi:hypothetical protein|nr:hypothetical protein [Gammaproteobacteria bacterium]
MKLTRLSIVVLILISMISCGTFEKATTLNTRTNYFPAKKNKIPSILIDIPTNPDTLKMMLVVPSTDYWLAMGKYMNYFDKVLTYDQFESEIVKKGLSDKITSLSDKVGLNRAYNYFQPFVILEMTKINKPGGGWFAGLALYDPKKADVIFQNEIRLNLMWDGWTDQGTMFPLFNSMLDYLRKQKINK